MLRAEQNKFITETGPGTPMGELFRRYWIPAMHASELPENECPPVRIKLLSERLLAWRDTQGRLALTDEFCAHRGVSLWFGRNEHNGLRCPYHGWKYDHTGQCIEVPSEPSESGFCRKIKLKSYPLIDRGGILWAYMGPPGAAAAVPRIRMDAAAGLALLQRQAPPGVQLPPGHGGRHRSESRVVSALQGHAHATRCTGTPRARTTRATRSRSSRSWNRPAGCTSRRAATPSRATTTGASPSASCRGTPWCRPTGTTRSTRHAFVPIDDDNCYTWTFTYHPTRPLSDMEVDVMKKGGGIHVPLIPGTFRPVINKDNDYKIDRAAQKRGETYCGVHGIAMQDAAVQESMGPIQDRTKENLVSTDNAIIMARHRLLRAAQELQKGAAPPGLTPAMQRVRSATFVLPVDVPFAEAKREDLTVREGVPHTSI